MKKRILIITATLFLIACGNKTNPSAQETDRLADQAEPTFEADSAYQSIVTQCNFGPRVMNSAAHEACGDYIVASFKAYGLQVIEQFADLKQYDGTLLKARNIIAQHNPKAKERILLCAHWDSRPWADNDPDEANHRKPVDAANDGASGVAMLLEIARLLQQQAPALGVDFICFDAEDCGTPQWADEGSDHENTWCLGSQYWATHPHVPAYKARFGILLDMVGGQGASFYQEGYSLQYAAAVVAKVWNAAESAGYGSFFPKKNSGFVTDDHVPVNKFAGIPTIDIIPYYADNPTSGFGPTWHTVNDTPSNIDRNTLRAVGQTVVHVIYNETVSTTCEPKE
ncbi:MAG: M28 family peptidase [Bacteroidaceae bacterium]